jgi:hypothetical protein
MVDFSHLDAIQLRLSHERARLDNATTEKEKALRVVWVAQIERELVAEYARLGIEPCEPCEPGDMSDAELLAELGI